MRINSESIYDALNFRYLYLRDSKVYHLIKDMDATQTIELEKRGRNISVAKYIINLAVLNAYCGIDMTYKFHRDVTLSSNKPAKPISLCKHCHRLFPIRYAQT